MKTLHIALAAMTIASEASAADAPCILKVYANSTLELHSGLEELYGLQRAPGNAYATFTCINPTNLQSHDLAEAELVVKSGAGVQTPVLKTWLDVNRYYLVTSFSYNSGEPVTLEFSANEVIDQAPVSFAKSYTFFDR